MKHFNSFNFKSWLVLCLLVLFSIGGNAQTARQRAGLEVMKTLHTYISTNYTQLGYDNLWPYFAQTDVRSNGEIWDIYSNISHFTYPTDQSSQVNSNEAVNYNREHSIPQSWFDSDEPMRSDLFHIYPVDAHLNSVRNNHPYGEVQTVLTASANNFSKYGTPTTECGAPVNVFEPNDEYKGDLARTYFYMVVRYSDKIGNWSGEVFGQPNKYDGYVGYPGMADWCIKMFLKWAKEDPVSQKEIDRNNAIFKVQGNRNPFIDCPGLERFIWSEYCEE